MVLDSITSDIRLNASWNWLLTDNIVINKDRKKRRKIKRWRDALKRRSTREQETDGWNLKVK